MADLTTAQAAAEIVALINARPQTPRQDEIESIVTRIARPMSDIGEAARRAQWNAAVGAANAAWAKYAEVEGAGGRPEEIEAREKAASALGRVVDECAKLIFREPVRSLADIVLLAEVCFYTLWSMDWRDPEADAHLADGPAHAVSGICADALAALLRAVRDWAPLTPDGDAVCTVDQAAELTFEPVPLEFRETNEEFANDYLPWVRFAFTVVARDHAGVAALVHDMRKDGEDGEAAIMEIGDNIETASQKFSALGEVLKTAHMRLLVGCAREALARDDGNA